MSRMECEIFIRMAGLIVGLSAFVGGQAFRDDDRVWVFAATVGMAIGVAVFFDMNRQIETFKHKDKFNGKDQ